MKTLFSLLVLLVTTSVLAWGQSQIFIDGVAYTNLQTVYLDCGRTSVSAAIAPAYDSNNEEVAVYWYTTSNFSTTPSNVQAVVTLNLDPNKNDGEVGAAYYANGGSSSGIKVYIKQKPPVPTFTASPTLCTPGSSAVFSVTDNYSFQSNKPIYFVWQTTGGITVNGSSSFSSPNGTSSSVTVQYNSYGTLSVYAVIAACNNLQGTAVSTNIGAYNQPSFTITGVAPYGAVDVQSNPPTTGTYNWYRDGSFLQSTASNYATLNGGSCGQQHYMQLAIQNQCGNSQLSSPQYYQYSCFYRVAYPTPAHNELTLELTGIEKPEYLPDEVVLVSEKSLAPVRSVKTQNSTSASTPDPSIITGSKTTKISFDVKDLPRGTYYLQIKNPRNVTNPVDAIRVILQ